MIQIIPAILTDSSERFKELVVKLGAYSSKIHLDIADGVFVPSKTIAGYPELGEIGFGAKFDVHLMVQRPQDQIENWFSIGVDRFIIQAESDVDLEVLISLIKNNARFTALEIADNLKIDARTVLKILDVLKKKKILQGYTVFIDLKKLGLQLHKLCIYLENYNPNEINRLLETLKQNKRMVHLIKSQGPWELEIEIEESNLENIYNYLKRLRNLFPDFIKRIDLVSITDEMKLDFFPENY